MEKEVVITYETLYEAVRKEKTKEELQKLEPTFYNDVLEYLKDKQEMHDRTITQEGFGNSEITQTQITNIRKLVKEMYYMRERKIINMAINKSRTGTNIIDTASLLPEEKKIYESIITVLNQNRQGILNKIQNMRQPNSIQEKKSKKIKFLEKVESLVDDELQLYGPYEIGDETELPTSVANVVIKQGKAEEI